MKTHPQSRLSTPSSVCVLRLMRCWESTHCVAIVKSNTLSDNAKEQAETAHTIRKHAEAMLHFLPCHLMENNNETESEKLTCSTLKNFFIEATTCLPTAAHTHRKAWHFSPLWGPEKLNARLINDENDQKNNNLGTVHKFKSHFFSSFFSPDTTKRMFMLPYRNSFTFWQKCIVPVLTVSLASGLNTK